jgi:hypothetical protein
MSQNVNGTTVRLWKVGGNYWDNLALTPLKVSAHLLSDWLPGVPAGQGAAFMGWPSRLLSSEWGQLCLSDLVERTERQWKGMISWMLGVAGARDHPRPYSANRDWTKEGRSCLPPANRREWACARPYYGDIVTGVNTPEGCLHD